MKIGKYIVIGLLLDIFDWIGFGLIPGLADIVDVGAAFLFYRKIGVAGLASMVELVPGFDLLPTNIVLGYMADQKENKNK